jgi:hypothetical protein
VSARRQARARDLDAAVAEYERVHWGQKGHYRVRSGIAADPSLPLVELGALVRVVYRTKKGNDRVLTDYHHDFSERGLPVLAYEPRTTLLVISGGIYRVNERGIID